MNELLILVGGFYLLVLPVLVIIAILRSGNLSREFEALKRLLAKAEQEIQALRRELNLLRSVAPAKSVAPAAAAPTPFVHRMAPAEPQPGIEAAGSPKPVQKSNVLDDTPEAAAQSTPVAASSPEKPPVPRPVARQAPPKPALPSLLAHVFKAGQDWLFGGNTLVRLGLLLVFLGLAFLLRYASDRVVVPIELRYIGVALSSLVALGLGWRLRLKRAAYALLMQGGAVAVMYLTVFAALKLHDQPLLSTQAGFALLVAVVVLSGLLAVVQNALALALAGALGGFAAPVLLSTGGGSHVALFSYFALLNAGILGIAWFKAWRPLNLVGFFGTFLIGLAWGLRSYDPQQHFASTEPFLLLFFLMFVAIGLLFARRVLLDDPDTPASRDVGEWTVWLARQGHRAQRYVDGTILFGTPLVGFGLQYGLIRHVEYGAAFSALALGLFYLVLARLVHGRNPVGHRLLTEVFLALGMIFASLAIPLGLDAQWTSAAWAVEAAGIYWVGHRQQRPLARAFALLLQAGATAALLSHISFGQETLLEGPTLGALMVGAALLCNMLVLRHHQAEAEAREGWDKGLGSLFSTLGLWGLFLILPMTLNPDLAAGALALAGLATALVGLRHGLPGWLANALLVQVAAGLVFLGQTGSGESSGVLAMSGSGLRGLIVASLIGLASLVSLAQAIQVARREGDRERVDRLAWATLFGLAFIALAVLFVLPWQTATAVWAACGLPLMGLALHLRLKPPFWFALFLETVAGLAFLASNGVGLTYYGALPDLAPFAHAAFWTPVVIALSAFAVAWRLHAYSRSGAASAPDAFAINGDGVVWSALVWAMAWWALAWWGELERIALFRGHLFLAVMSATALLGLPIMKRWQWPGLAGLTGLLLPLAALVALNDYAIDVDLLAGYGWLGFGLALAAGFGLLRVADGLLGKSGQRRLHLVNTWVWLGVAALEMRQVFLMLSEEGSAWRWLGWVLPLAFWMLWNARPKPPRWWPAAAHPQLYRYEATAPLLAVLLAWLAMANVLSSGSADPLPFLPLFNPLDLALVLVLYSGWQWRRRLAGLAPGICLYQPWQGLFRHALLAGAFLTYTCVVLRGAHHLAGVAWHLDGMMHSMLVQASLSIAWALLALGLMVSGSRHSRRAVWIAGAVLIAVVLAKLFLVELSNRNGLERIVSFLGVGILLLVVGYFAPLPPAKGREEAP